MTLPSSTFGDHDHEEHDEDQYHPELTITCQYYKRKDCEDKGECNETTKICPASHGKRQGCFTLWHHGNKTDQPEVQMKDCFISQDCDQHECIDNEFNRTSNNFCCCKDDMCNSKFKWIPVYKETSTTPADENEDELESNDKTKYVLASCLLLSLVGFCFAFKFFYHRKNGIFNEIPTMEPELSISSQCLAIRPIELQEIKAHGRFGIVWKGKMKNDDVAVKVFPTQDKNSWITEQEIYKLPRMNHPNILHFIGAEKHIFQDGKTEFWLITEYHTYGSLCDYLKSHTVTWQELCKIAESMSRGLMHLHEEIPGNRTEELKPAIAHRDFKSKNVLLKSDLTACIADFGLALVFSSPCGDIHGQVGTRRYMAPEILGKISSFLCAVIYIAVITSYTCLNWITKSVIYSVDT